MNVSTTLLLAVGNRGTVRTGLSGRTRDGNDIRERFGVCMPIEIISITKPYTEMESFRQIYSEYVPRQGSLQLLLCKAQPATIFTVEETSTLI